MVAVVDFPKREGKMRPKPCPGHYLKNGDFLCDTGRRIKGPLCKSCAGLVNQGKCLACRMKQGGEK